MDSFNQYGSHAYKNVQNVSKVYINPNFQGNRATPTLKNGAMYLNPQFHKHPNLEPANANKPKIHFNPNFVRTNTPISTISNPYSTAINNSIIISTPNVNSFYGMPSVSMGNGKTNSQVLGSYYALTSGTEPNVYYANCRNSTVTSTDSFQLPNMTPYILPQNTEQPVAVAKSRYSIVRQNNNTVNNLGTHIKDKIITKVKISKYKTVSIDQVKKMQIEKDKLMPKALPQTHVEKTRKIICRADFIKSRFQLRKTNMGTKAMKIELKLSVKRKHSLNYSSKILLRSNQKVKTTVEMKKYKKNNIPCPLFKKYGTCLRNTRGKCEFLHDRKHVSICRRFLKGVCHDKNCLLSHEATAEKMPTCFFYLKGMCTKEDCPYLHVKLNEKTKICLDFLKGYCEKGNKCLNRHVNICPDLATKGTCIRNNCPYPHRMNKTSTVNRIKTRKINQSINLTINTKVNKKAKNADGLHQIVNLEENKSKDSRYYKEVVEDGHPVEVEVIKPLRCKLGALPSFIQL